ncbi:MAG: hypothetical protein J0G95_04785 [Rhizobiales bacterium]|nr:hypothetical protein [Hyphomicrobiales bacterium]
MDKPPHTQSVITGLVPVIHAFLLILTQDVDGRVKPGHDDSLQALGN